MRNTRGLKRLTWLLAGAAIAPSLALAATTAATSADSSSTLEEVVVTARKRSETIQTVPLSISAIGAEQIQRQGVKNLDDVAKLSPGLIYDQGFSATDTRPMIRGMAAARGRPGVSVLVDGIDLTSESIITAGGFGLLNMRLNDIERIEIVRGPQSTIYGRNAFGGAINYVTAKPSDTFQAGLSLDAGNYGLLDAGGYINGPITDKVAARLNFAHHEIDGYYRNTINNAETGAEQSNGARLQVLFTPTDKFKVNVTAEYTEEHDLQKAAALLQSNTTTTYPKPTTANPSARSSYGVFIGDVAADASGVRYIGNLLGYKFHTQRGAIDAQYDLGFATLTSITSAVHSRGEDSEDGSFGLVAASPSSVMATRAFSDTFSNYEQYSEDLRITSNGDGKLKYLAGVYLFDEQAKEIDAGQSYFVNCSALIYIPTARCAVGTSQTPNRASTVTPNPVTRDTKSGSIYGSVGYEILPRLTVTAEARYTEEKVEAQQYTWTVVPAAVQRFGFTAPLGHVYADMFGLTSPTVMRAQTKSHYLNPRLTVDYKLTPDVLLYANVAKGTKPGGVSQLSSTANYDLTRYQPEQVWTGELGGKTSWLERKLVLNAATYYSRYTDQQVSLQDYSGAQIVTRVQNAGVVIIYGLEADLAYRPTRNLTFTANYAYTHARYDEFLDSSTPSLAVAPTVTKQTSAGPIAYADLSGYKVPGVPDHQGAVSARYEWPIQAFGGASAYVEANANYRSSRFAESDYANTIKLKAYWMADAQAGLETDRWTAALYVRNLTDERVVTNAIKYIDLTSSTFNEAVVAYLPTPRTYGLRLSFKY